MAIYKVIHQITEKQFEVRQFEANSADEYDLNKHKLGIAYDDIHYGKPQKKDYSAGDFIIQWRTNFGYEKQSNAHAYVLYYNRKQDTKTFVKSYENIPSLEDVAALMNKYANMNNDGFRSLFDDVVDRLGMYHHEFRDNTSYDFMLESLNADRTSKQLGKLDYDNACIRELQKSMKVAIDLQVKCEILYRISTHLDRVEESTIKDIKERLAKINDEYQIGKVNLVYNGLYGHKHLVGNYDYMANPPKIEAS